MLPLSTKGSRVMSAARTRKSKNEGRSRFSDEQIRVLESMFETQSRPELRMKQHLANKLGLHTRQVAIWFQNRRARLKSRQTEQDYNNLKHNYEMLMLKSNSLKEDIQALLTQLQSLKDLSKKQQRNKTIRPDFMNKSSKEDCHGKITLSMIADPKVASENYIQEISAPFYGGHTSSYAGEDGKFGKILEHKGSFCPDHPSWWEF